MAKAPRDIRSLARSHTETAVRTLVGIMEQSSAPPAARVSAASVILDRGWGKPTQPVDGDGEGGAMHMVHEIVRRVIHTDDDSASDDAVTGD